MVLRGTSRSAGGFPRSGNPGRIAENIDIFDFELTADDMDRIPDLSGEAEVTDRTSSDLTPLLRVAQRWRSPRGIATTARLGTKPATRSGHAGRRIKAHQMPKRVV